MSSINDGQPAKRSALGKGFEALLSTETVVQEKTVTQQKIDPMDAVISIQSAVVKLAVLDIEPNPHQPRKIFDDEAMDSLVASIKEDGVVQPIIVTKSKGQNKFILIAGERRWRASKKAGFEHIPAIIKEATDEAMLRLAIIENVQRSDLSVIEEAEAYQSLIRDFGLSQDQCAKKVGKDRSTVANTLRILNLPREIQDDLLEKKLTMGHGRAILALEDKKAMLRARDVIVKKSLNVRQTEQLCKRAKQDEKALQGGEKATEVDPDLEYLAETIRNNLRTKVKILGNSARGRIEISYFSAAELERLIEQLSP